MEHRTWTSATAVAAAAVFALAGCAGQGESADSTQPTGSTQSSAAPSAAPQSAAPSSEPAAKAGKRAGAAEPAGGYIDYAEYSRAKTDYADSDVVLFFNASWCPTCQEAQGNLESASFPAGLTVVSVDYDDSDELKQRYGVTTQHTFVQIDESGEQLAKFTGATTLDQISGQLA